MRTLRSFVIWLSTGGPSRPKSNSGFFIEPPAPLGGGDSYGTVEAGPDGLVIKGVGNQKSTAPSTVDTVTVTNPFTGNPSLVQGTAGIAKTINEEYFSIQAGDAQKFRLTGLSVRSEKGKAVTLGGATKLLKFGVINQEDLLFLEKGGTAIVSSGRSPLESPSSKQMLWLSRSLL